MHHGSLLLLPSETVVVVVAAAGAVARVWNKAALTSPTRVLDVFAGKTKTMLRVGLGEEEEEEEEEEAADDGRWMVTRCS